MTQRLGQRLWILCAIVALWFMHTSAVWAIEPDLGSPNSNASTQLDRGAQIFEMHCSGCHAGGGNIIRRGKNLKLKALRKNQMDTIAAIETIVTQGKANMSAYGDRLTASEITAVATYVLHQAENDWK